MNNVTSSLDLANGTWAFFHIVVTDANQIIYDVQYTPLNSSGEDQRYRELKMMGKRETERSTERKRKRKRDRRQRQRESD